MLDGKAMSPSEITKLADLESREVLLAKLAGAMKASMADAAATFNALPVQMAQLAEALRAKRAEAEGGAPRPPAAEAAAEASEAEAPRLRRAPAEAALRGGPPTRRPRRATSDEG